MSAHTPGKWTLIIGGGSPTGYKGNYEIAEALDEEHVANARLIAAAPELLAVCENLTAQIKATIDPKNWETVSTENTGIVKALDTIRKAKGA